MATIKISASVCQQIESDYENDPKNALTLKSIRQAVKSMIQTAIEDGLNPAALPVTSEPGVSMNITFEANHSRAIRQLAKQQMIREGDAALKYLYAALSRGDAQTLKKPNASFLDGYTSARGLSRRPQQVLFAQSVLSSLQSKNIGLIEAATGVGKTLGIVAACSELISQSSFCRVVVAVPSIQLIRQFAVEHRALEQAMPMPAARCVMGRNEFINTQELEAILQSGTELLDPGPIRQWLAQGAPALNEDAPFELPYLASSLRQISPDFPIDAVRLGTDSDQDDPGTKAYESQFEREIAEEPTSEIIYCTHAMLAIDIRKRRTWARQSELGQQIKEDIWAFSQPKNIEGLAPEERKELMSSAIEQEIKELAALTMDKDVGILPAWQHLVIDEAHAFESNMANILATNISLGSVLRNLMHMADQGWLSKAAAKQATIAMNAIRDQANNDEHDLSSTSPATRHVYAALQNLHELARSVKSGAKQSPHYTQLSIQARAIDLALKVAISQYGQRAMVSYSPVRAYPQLNIGRQSVANELKFLWQSTVSAAAVSATLYLRKLEKDSAAYSASVLSVPNTRLMEFPVIRPAWTYRPVQAVWLPEPTKVGNSWWLRPPTRSDKLKGAQQESGEALWLDELGTAISDIHRTAQGGVLVLMTSYSSAQGLAQRLDPNITSKIVASTKHSLVEQMNHFVKRRLTGEKTIWIAVGSAWTGVDINGASYGIEDPQQDNMLTDLIIPRLPFGLNKSMTHKTRTESLSSVPWELLDAAMRFKQGLGRLVRREGLPNNRRIFVLDGRFSDPAFENYLSHFKRVMAPYTLKHWISSDENYKKWL